MMLTVSKLAREAGVGVETIRYYEKRGLIVRPDQREGYRKYGAGDVARLKFIKSAQRLGFTLNEISDLIQLEQDQHAQCGDLHERAQAKIEMIDAKVAELQRMRQELTRVQCECPPDQPLAKCDLIGCLSGTC